MIIRTTLNKEKAVKAWMDATKAYNSVGTVLDMLATEAVRDAYDCIEETPLFRHQLKKSMKRAMEIAGKYDANAQVAYGEKFSLLFDYNMEMQKQMDAKVFILYNCVHRWLSTRVRKDRLTACAKMLTAQVLVDNAVAFHHHFFERVVKETQIPIIRDMFEYADLSNLAAWTEKACRALMPFAEDAWDDFRRDRQKETAVLSINRHLEAEDHLNEAARLACSRDMAQYGEALRQLEENDAKIKAEQEAEKAAVAAAKAEAERQAAEAKKTRQRAADAALVDRLSSKYKVSRL